MPRLGAGLILGGLVAVIAASTAQQGCKDAVHSLTTWRYPGIRDMRTSVAILPQKTVTRAPDDASVPTVGRDVAGEDPPYEKGQFRANPIAASDSSIARGEQKFAKTCVPCHGKALAGDGPVAPLFMPPPDLLAEATRNRKDGFIYAYIRFGGVVMPPYGAQVSAEEAWNIVNYIRHMQQRSPR
jgi:mono/diheme cytochrome c family protein